MLLGLGCFYNFNGVLNACSCVTGRSWSTAVNKTLCVLLNICLKYKLLEDFPILSALSFHLPVSVLLNKMREPTVVGASHRSLTPESIQRFILFWLFTEQHYFFGLCAKMFWVILCGTYWFLIPSDCASSSNSLSFCLSLCIFHPHKERKAWILTPATLKGFFLYGLSP